MNMRHLFFASVAGLALCGCIQRYEPPTTITFPRPPSVAESTSSSSVHEIDSAPDRGSLVITDQRYLIGEVRGREWIQAIGAKKLRGNIQNANLTVTISRNQDSGWGAVGMYLAPLAPDGQINVEHEWKNTRYLAAQWKGTCHRHLAPSISFGVLDGPSKTITVPLSSVPVSAADPCDPSLNHVDIESLINADGVILGFLPSDQSFSIKASVSFDGRLNAEVFEL